MVPMARSEHDYVQPLNDQGNRSASFERPMATWSFYGRKREAQKSQSPCEWGISDTFNEVEGLIDNIPALVQIMAWCRSGDKPLSEPMMA